MNTLNKPPLKILLVEDEPVVMMVTRMFFQDLGYEPDIAETGKRAIELSVKKYDLIFMDIGLPDIDGISVTKKIRKEEKGKKYKSANIIVLTAYNIADVLEKCLSVGVDEVHNKPINPKILLDIINKQSLC